MSEFKKKIVEALSLAGEGEVYIDTLFDVEEDKEGFFVARLQPKQFLDPIQFKAMCALVRDLGGEDYLEGAKAWKVPGPFAKKGIAKPQNRDSNPAAVNGAAPPLITQDKSRPQLAVPIGALLSLPYQCRGLVEDSEFNDLVESVKAYGVVEPVVVRPKPNGRYEIVAGERRVAAAKKAGLVEVPVVVRFLSDEETLVIRLIENIHRKDLSEMEKSQVLSELAKSTGWTAQQIAEKLKMSERWVYKYLPSEFKQPEPEQLASARRALSSESQDATELQDMRQAVQQAEAAYRKLDYQKLGSTVSCDRCGDPVSVPVHLEGRFYCMDCAELVQAEKKPGLVPETKHDFAGDDGLAKPSVAIIDTGEFQCPECHKNFIVEHLSNGRHKLQSVETLKGGAQT